MEKWVKEAWDRGARLALEGRKAELEALLEELRARGERGRALAYLLEEYYFVKRGEPLKVVKLAKAVISHTSDPAFLRMAYSHLAWALRATGDLASSNAAASKALELSERAGGREEMLAFLATNMLLGGEFSRAEELLAGFRGWQGVAKAKALHLLGLIRVAQGRFREARELAQELGEEPRVRPGAASELLGMALEGLGMWEEAAGAYLRGLREELARRNSYSLFFVNKLLRLKAALGLEPSFSPEEARLAKALAKGSPEGRAALGEAKALEAWLRGKRDALGELAEASEAYIRVNQPLEAVEASGLACLLARREDAGGFWSALGVIGSLNRTYGSFLREHALFRELYRDALSPLLEAKAPGSRVRVRLLGRLSFDGLKPPDSWRLKKALRIFLYLLVNGGKPVSTEYLAWLLWPELEPERAKKRLYTAGSWLRRELGELGRALKSSWGSYRLEAGSFWVDLWEFRELAREGLSKRDLPSLLRALELYRGELLEGFEDGWAREAREEAHSQFLRCLSLAAELLLEEGRVREAVSLVEGFRSRFSDPGTERVCAEVRERAGNLL